MTLGKPRQQPCRSVIVRLAHNNADEFQFYTGRSVFAVLCLAVLQRCNCQDARIRSTINDQIESLRLAQSYTNVTGLLNEVVATANSGTNQILGNGF